MYYKGYGELDNKVRNCKNLMIIILRGETAMIKKELEILREQINTMITSDDSCKEDLLRLSQELDALIIEFMRQEK